MTTDKAIITKLDQKINKINNTSSKIRNKGYGLGHVTYSIILEPPLYLCNG